MECAAVWFKSLPLWLAVLLAWTSGHVAQQTVSTTILDGNLKVTLGNVSAITFNCIVLPGNTSALISWKFNGLVLAPSSKYTITTSSNNNFTSLTVSSISVSEDGTYSCIVVGTLDFKGSTSSVNLEVQAPPQSVHIVGYESAQAVVVVAYRADFVNLTCSVSAARPAAELLWFKGGEQLSTYVTADSVSLDGNGKTFTTIKNLSIPQPGRELNKVPFACVVKQPALTALGRQMNVSRNLSVYYPPGSPQITDYQDRIMRPGDTLMATCISYDGNPQPSVHWYKNGLPFFLTYISNEDRRTVTSQLLTTVNATDNDAIFRCEVKNVAIATPLYNEIKLNVKFAPSSVVITGNTKLRAGKAVTLTCTSSNSNPAADITWTSRSQIIPSASSQDPSPLGGFVTTSNITVSVQADDQVMYTCTATNNLLGQSAYTTALLEVFYPPSKPEIKGYNETGFILYKTVVRLTCTTIGGRPDPTLTWYKGIVQLNTAKPQKLLGSITTSEIEFIAQPDDNLALYRCTASNEATDVPLETSIQLKVFFPPQNVTIAVQQLPVREGVPVSFICDSGASNPAPRMSWILSSGSFDGNGNGTRAAEYNGLSSINWYVMTPTKDDDGTKISCTAKNMEIGESMTTGLTLDVHHKPYFPASIFASKLEVALGTNVSANFTPVAKPPATDFKWFKLFDTPTLLAADASPVLAFGGYLNFINVARTNAGTYRVNATNMEGSNSFDFLLDVKYAASITKAECTANAAGGAVCVCTADANPQVDNMVVWKGKDGYNMTAGKSQTYAGGNATLTIFDVRMEDIGDFQCIADNSQGPPAVQNVTLLVPIRPVILREQQYAKAALTSNGSSAIYCYITSYPRPTVEWTHNEAAVNLLSGKFSSTVKEWGSKFTFRAELMLKGGNQSDFGSYACLASTDRGSDTWSVNLEGTSVPDPPYDIKVVNVTSDRILVSWTPGFNGGLTQHYNVRYRAVKAAARGYNYMDAYTPAYFEIPKLDPSTKYEITAAGVNRLGIGAYQSASVSATTLVDPSAKETRADEDVTLIIILCVVIVGVIFLVLNAFLIVLFIRRKRRLLLDENASQANTLELYGTTDMSALGETDEAKSYTTYEKSVDCDDEYKHYEDDDDEDDEIDARKGSRYGPPPGTYLVDDPIIPPPPQPWAKADIASRDQYGYGTYSIQPLVDNSQDLSPEGYAMELRSIGRTLPLTSQMTDSRHRSRPSFVAGRPPAPPPPMLQQWPPQMLIPPPADDGRSSEAPPLPVRRYSQDEALADSCAYAISADGLRTHDRPTGAAGLAVNADVRGHLV